MKKLFVFLSILLLFQCTAQKSTTISSTGITTLKGIGSLGGTTDKISVRRYNNTLSTPYLYGAYFKTISDKKAGVGISIRNDSTSSLDGKLQSAHVILRNDSLLVYKRSTYNQTLSKIYGKANVPLPTYLTAEANGNKLKIYTSKKSDGINLTKILDKDSVFLGWRYKTPNLLFPIAKQVSSVDITGISIKTAIVDTTGSNAPSNNTGGGGNSGGGGDSTTVDSTMIVSITEPNRSQYYYSDFHAPSYYDDTTHKPSVFHNYDNYTVGGNVVWLQNGYIKIGINLKAGGQICYLSKSNSSTNLVNNYLDLGRQIQVDAYQSPYNYIQGGEVAGAIDAFAPNQYNTTMGGDYQAYTMSLIDYHPITNGYYVKFRPILWPMTAKVSEVFIEAKYTLIGNAVKCEYTYTSFRHDNQFQDDGAANGAAVPAVFLIDRLTHYRMYMGSQPWTDSTTTGGRIPIQSNGESVLGNRPSEKWLYVYNPADTSTGVGLYNPNTSLTVIKQLYPDLTGGNEFTGGFTYMHTYQVFNDIINDVFQPLNHANFTRTMTAFLSVGSETEVRNRFKIISNLY